MPKSYRDTDDPREALADLLAYSSRDFSQSKADAWLYGVVLGWDDEDDPDDGAMAEVAAHVGWDDYDVARLRRLHANFKRLALPHLPRAAELRAPMATPRVQSRTFVIANSIDAAREWCRANGVEPYGRRTVIVTRPRALDGRTIWPHDRVVEVSDGGRWHAGDQLAAVIRHAKQKGGTPVEPVTTSNPIKENPSA